MVTWTLYCYASIDGHLRPCIVTIFLCMITHDLLLLKHFPVGSLATIYYNFPLRDHLRPSTVTTFPCMFTYYPSWLQPIPVLQQVLFLQADSGGPLMVRDDERIVVVGVISTGIGCAKPKLPGLYTRISSYSTWIRAHVQEPWRHPNTWILRKRVLHRAAGLGVLTALSLPEGIKEGQV